ncbi:MAG: hypothetical protein A2161_10625 [Candidatus Schekmanbacteria bacterium RBG_13_48_7]|uniref:Uncharacterized protein n=1 Tax=Candidatus Schekmanbacteria bacterium RBG_13_48_7 TaxID=1817878 RepID=A0A1F7RV60_9BACT|nr:MAG: hypothetical protein A2161_10625 [Candidatus Schekmanbacteria bacterium RBG_13_48_7]
MYFYNSQFQKEYLYKLQENIDPQMLFLYNGEPHFFVEKGVICFCLNDKKMSFSEEILLQNAKAMHDRSTDSSYQNGYITGHDLDGYLWYVDLEMHLFDKFKIWKSKGNINPQKFTFWTNEILFSVYSENYQNIVFRITNEKSVISQIYFPFDLEDLFPFRCKTEKCDDERGYWFGISKEGDCAIIDEISKQTYCARNNELKECLRKNHKIFVDKDKILIINEDTIKIFKISGINPK